MRYRLGTRTVTHRLLCAVTLLVLVGCSEGTTEPGLPSVGERTQVCADRVDVTQAQAVVGPNLATLHELNTFTPTKRTGECALLDADGAAQLSVQVVHDPSGKALAAELKKLSEQDAYTGDDHSGVSGDARTTTALWAVDGNYYVRVLGLSGTSEAQRQAALDLAAQVATRTAALK